MYQKWNFPISLQIYDNEKVLTKIRKIDHFIPSYIFQKFHSEISFRNLALAYAYEAENCCVGVIFDFKQDSHKRGHV